MQVIAHLTLKRPLDVDRTQFFSQAEAFAMLCKLDYVTIDGGHLGGELGDGVAGGGPKSRSWELGTGSCLGRGGAGSRWERQWETGWVAKG